MEQDQKQKYIGALAFAIGLVIGERNDDYNSSGIELRDYWQVNGIKSPIQMVDMKLKRARSQVGGWDIEQMGPDKPVPTSKKQVEKLTESMVDLINYAAFVVCEAMSLYEEQVESATGEKLVLEHTELASIISNCIDVYQANKSRRK